MKTITGIFIAVLLVSILMPIAFSILFNSTSAETTINEYSIQLTGLGNPTGRTASASDIRLSSMPVGLTEQTFIVDITGAITNVNLVVTNNDRVTVGGTAYLYLDNYSTVTPPDPDDQMFWDIDDSVNTTYNLSNIDTGGAPLNFNSGNELVISIYTGNGGSGDFDGLLTIEVTQSTSNEIPQVFFLIPVISAIAILLYIFKEARA